MTTPPDGGPAFPGFSYTDGRGPHKQNANGEWECYVPGISRRDYFAARALHGQISYEGLEGCDKHQIAAMCYEMADAMIEASKPSNT